MAQKLKILKFPDPKLRIVAKKVTKFDKSLQNLASDMLYTMYEENGIGLAATQVDEHIRLIVMDLSDERDKPMFFVNPVYKILDNHSMASFEEGCLSVPGFYEPVERFNQITYSFHDLKGGLRESNANGLLAVCIQHEIDHLDGKLFVDYICDIKRDRIAKKIKKQTSQGILSARKGVPYSI